MILFRQKHPRWHERPAGRIALDTTGPQPTPPTGQATVLAAPTGAIPSAGRYRRLRRAAPVRGAYTR
jgi:hypothetical protein